jgi:hypothetical protein
MRRLAILASLVVAPWLVPGVAAAAGWTLESTPAPATALSTEFDSVSCPTATACVTVGHWVGAARIALTLAEVWDGSSWAISPTANLAGGQGSMLEGVSCPRARSCVAVGVQELTAASQPVRTLAERLDAGRWTVLSTPGRTALGINTLWSVSCPTSRVCTAVGYVTDGGLTTTLAERWQNGHWHIQPTPNPPGSQPSALYGVSCPTVTDCTATGYSGGDVLVERWDAGRWRIEPTPAVPGASGAALVAVACTAATACTAVGNEDANTGGEHALAERYDGRTWQIEPVPEPPGSSGSLLDGVSCPALRVCEAVGGAPSLFLTGNPSLAERWDGSAWSVQSTPNPAGAQTSFLSSISCPTTTGCMATGTYFTATTQYGFAESYSGAG